MMMGMSTTRKTMDFEKEYEQFVNELNSRAAPKAASAGDAGEAGSGALGTTQAHARRMVCSTRRHETENKASL